MVNEMKKNKLSIPEEFQKKLKKVVEPTFVDPMLAT